MTFTYSSSAPGDDSVSLVRLLIGDNSSGAALLQDEEISAFIALEGNTYSAASAASRSIAAQFSRRADQMVGSLSVELSQVSRSFLRQADILAKRAKRGASIYAGGISHSDVAAVQDDTDQVRGNFKIGMTDLAGYLNPDQTDSTEA